MTLQDLLDKHGIDIHTEDAAFVVADGILVLRRTEAGPELLAFPADLVRFEPEMKVFEEEQTDEERTNEG